MTKREFLEAYMLARAAAHGAEELSALRAEQKNDPAGATPFQMATAVDRMLAEAAWEFLEGA